MQRHITGFHLDERNDWVAELDCHHNQHTRHKPPLISRPWVVTQEGRDSMLGATLDCVRCDRLEFPDGLHEYKRTPVFTEDSIPAGLLNDHNTKLGVWGLIHVEEGTLLYTVHASQAHTHVLNAVDKGLVAPLMKHRVEARGKVKFFVAFHRKHGNEGGDSGLLDQENGGRSP
jgi:tellurite methyltransferase